MVERLIERGISDRRLIRASDGVARENYVPSELTSLAYDDTPIPLGEKSLLQHPWIIAYILEALEIREGDRILELGTGSGYQAAILARLARSVITIEPSKQMAITAFLRLRVDGKNVKLYTGTLRDGFPAFAPYDVIVCNPSLNEMPEKFMAQLKVGGRMIFPFKEGSYDQLIKIERTSEDFDRQALLKLQYIPLTGPSKKKKNSAQQERSGSSPGDISNLDDI